ncbi:NAD(P)H-binding protein [Shimazuella sp. AN120528]|uniref:NAD(P)H-binding protein n=1 Tax=Shimazuella soli TaxID=1892854 RepID=UPI001F0FA41C|nr:NAD(P)H-binding protein [Shimazuella soli]MCH5586598.1 NAD(P)H-binding protein [Shimazuella soli]
MTNVNSSEKKSILVTGATGNVGREIISQLHQQNIFVRAITRNPQLANFPMGTEILYGDLSQPEESYFDNIDVMYLMWPFHTSEAAPLIVEMAKKKHIRRIVFLSSGAVKDDLSPEQYTEPIGRSHSEVEQLIEQSGLEYTFLRPSTFAVNTIWWADQIRKGDIVKGAYGTVCMNLIHEADIAAVAVQALTSNKHNKARYVLTGPETLSQKEQVHIIGKALNRPLEWIELSHQEAQKYLLADDSFPSSFVDILLNGYAKMLTTPKPIITSTVQEITGRDARTFYQWVLDHIDEFH